jgi:hypothetical protein
MIEKKESEDVLALVFLEKSIFLAAEKNSRDLSRSLVMKKCILLFLFLVLSLLSSSSAFSQKSVQLGDNLPANVDPLNFNLLATKKVLEKKIIINEKKFSEGYFIQARDTIHCQIYTEKSVFRPLLFIITKISDSIYVLTPSQVKEYVVLGNRYIRHFSYSSNFKNLFFMRELDKGKINLYSKPGIPSDPSLAFYISNDGNRTFYSINPSTRTVAINEEKGRREAELRGQPENIM